MREQATSIHNDLLEVLTQELRTTKDELAATKKELLATQQKLHLSHTAQNQRAHEEQQRLKEDFLSAIDHELRTPLSNMKMAIHLLKTAPIKLEQERYLEIIQAMCAREIELITNLLDLQRLEVGSYSEVLVEVVNLQSWIPSLLEPFCYLPQQRKQTLQVNLPPEIPPLLIDRVSLRRILTELLNNACKYTPVGGAIALSVHHDQLVFEENSEPETHYLYPAAEAKLPTKRGSDSPQFTGVTTFTIRNSTEIHPSELSRIFEKFYRVPQHDPWQQGGMGLGLALVQKLVEHLRGTIQVESRQGWTTFTVSFAS
jgi:signal transduction histidine kinase